MLNALAHRKVNFFNSQDSQVPSKTELFQAYCRAEGIGKQCRSAAASVMCALRSIECRNMSTRLHGNRISGEACAAAWLIGQLSRLV